MKKKVLVLCTGNSCRSQMAEGYLRAFAGEKIEIFSAGVEKHGVNPRAIAAMKEDGVNIADHTSNLLDEYAHLDFDYVITVCDSAKERCPYFPAKAKKIHRDFPDPAKAVGSDKEIMQEFIRVRDLIKIYCKDFIAEHINN